MTKRWRLVGKELYDMQADPAQEKDVAEAHPKVVSRLSAALRDVEAKNDTKRQRCVIGSDKQDPTEFRPDAWSMRQRSIGFWQKGITSGGAGMAPILAEVEVTGTYRFCLRRWPEEVDKPIRASAKVSVPDGLSGDTKTERGRALPIVKARLRVGDFDKTIDVTDDMVQATFTAPLKKGDCDILAEFIGDDGKEYGAYFLYVTRQ